MNSIFVISKCSGDYYERTVINICAVQSETRANRILEKLEELQEFNIAFQPQEQAAWDRINLEWEEKIPFLKSQ